MYTLSTGYLQITNRIYVDYIQIIYRLYTDYIQIIYLLYTDYIQRLYTDYIQILYRFSHNSRQLDRMSILKKNIVGFLVIFLY